MLVFGIIFIGAGSPKIGSLTQASYDNYFAYSLLGIIFTAAGLIMSIVFNHVFYSNSLSTIAYVIVVAALEIVAAIFV
jgi:uncharacterized membrane protein YphA (DoxX/SURF4 family)